VLIFVDCMQDIAEPSRLPQYFRPNQSMTVTPYVGMCKMDFTQFILERITEKKKLSERSNFTCINICDATIVLRGIYYFYCI
jgi:hypothetical protein